jgi:hypothetical protein
MQEEVGLLNDMLFKQSGKILHVLLTTFPAKALCQELLYLHIKAFLNITLLYSVFSVAYKDTGSS